MMIAPDFPVLPESGGMLGSSGCLALEKTTLTIYSTKTAGWDVTTTMGYTSSCHIFLNPGPVQNSSVDISCEENLPPLSMPRELNINQSSTWFLQQSIPAEPSSSSERRLLLQWIVETDKGYMGGESLEENLKKPVKIQESALNTTDRFGLIVERSLCSNMCSSLPRSCMDSVTYARSTYGNSPELNSITNM